MAEIQLKIIDRDKYELWNELIEKVEYGTIFHTIEWMNILEEVYKVRKIPIGIFQRNNLVGVFPAFIQKKAILKLVMSPLQGAATPYGGPVLLDNKLATEALVEFDRFVRANFKADYIDIKIAPNLGINDLESLQSLGYAYEERYTYILELSRSIEQIWDNLEGRCRTAIRKARKDKVSIIEAKDERYINDYCNMAMDTWKRSNRPPLISRQFYNHVLHAFQPQNAKVLFAEYNEQLIAGAVFLSFKDKLYYWDGVSYSYEESRKVSPNNLIIWELIEWANNNGFKIFDMVGAQVPGIAKFKASFGGGLVAYPYLYRSTSLMSNVSRALYKRFVHGG